jgi:hypothetical protein
MLLPDSIARCRKRTTERQSVAPKRSKIAADQPTAVSVEKPGRGEERRQQRSGEPDIAVRDPVDQHAIDRMDDQQHKLKTPKWFSPKIW